jgi:FkbM family methyltransferase
VVTASEATRGPKVVGVKVTLIRQCYALLYRLNSVLKRVGAGKILSRWQPATRGLDHIKRLIQREVWVQVQSGLSRGMWMRLRLPGEGAYWQGTHEPDVQNAIFCAVQPGMVVYDIGAHLGSIALGTARLVGKLGCVVAFDGDPENIVRLKENVRRNGLADRLRVVHGAVWSSTRSDGIPFRRGGAVKSRGGVEANGNRPVVGTGEIITVPAITLDEFIGSGGPQPHLVKIDVEGGEHEVLQGGARFFRSQRPLILAEVHHQEAVDQICSWLNHYQYCLQWHRPQVGVAVDSEGWDAKDFPRRLFAWPSDYEGATWMARVYLRPA